MQKVAILAAVLVFPLAARADFVLTATPSSGPLTSQLPLNARPQALPVVRPPAPKLLARGFGTNQPLETALRDILPAGTKSQLSAAVDPQSRVTWRGERPWAVVLREAVAPLGVSVRQVADGVVLSR